MAKGITIQVPRPGIAQSPHVGFGDVRNLDISSVPGVAKLNNIQVKKSGTTVTDSIWWFVRNPLSSANVYALDNDGVVYNSTDSGATWASLSDRGGNGQGLAIWKDYLFVAETTTIDVYGPLSGTPAWTDNWMTIESDSLWHPMLVSKNDGSLYGGAGRYVFNVYEDSQSTFTVTIATPAVFSKTAHGLAAGDILYFTTTGALPTGLSVNTFYYVIAAGLTADAFEVSATSGGAAINTSGSQSGTHTYVKINQSTQALDLPVSYRIKCLEELGNNLMIGTWQGTNVYDIRVADIFPWDRSAVSFGQPIVMAEYGVHAMLNTGNSLLVLAGINGTVFRCDGVNAYPVGQLPMDLSGGKYLEWYPGSICNYKNKVFFGVGQGGTTAIPAMGVYSLEQTGRGNILNFEHTVSTLNDGTTNPLKPTALLPMTRDTILVGWRDNTTYGIDLTTATSYAYTTDYSGFLDSPLYEVGTDKNKWKPMSAELRLGRPLRTGEGVKILYRTNLADSFTAVKTMAFADNGIGAIISKTFTIQIPDNVKESEHIQFRVALLGTATTSPEFKSLTIE